MHPAGVDAIVGLGSNLGSREALLRAAARILGDDPSITVEARSRLYRTDPVGPPQPDYLNAALVLSTPLSPRALLDRLLAVEARLGRVRAERWGPRTLDLDLLVCDEEVDEPGLTVPHPRLRERAFALAPLLDVAAARVDVYGADLERVGGAPAVREWTEPVATDARELTVEALDDADALALAAWAWFDAAPGSSTAAFEAIRAPDPLSFARAAAGPCVIFERGAEMIRGASARGIGPHRPIESVRVRGGKCVIRGGFGP